MPDYPGTPGGEEGIKDTYIAAIRAAEEYIYIEDQYFRSATMATELANAMSRNPHLIVIVVCLPDQFSQFDPDPNAFAIGTLSSYWTHAAYQTLCAVRSNFVLFFLQTTYTNRRGSVVYVPINIHSKIMLVDDAWYTIGSCNVNDRGFETEGELNVSVHHDSARDLRIRIFENILGVTCPPNIRQATQLWFEHARLNNRSLTSNTKPRSKVFSYGQRGPLLPALPQDWI
jgi:phosphatidylserine/phosphatidylglycerophosphate/cardiolipin synthase-like enzyme